MAYSIYMLKFTNGIHIGNSNLNKEATKETMSSDVFFGAVYNEYMNIFGDDEFINILNNDNFLISDLFPYKDNFLYIPKPFITVERKMEVSQITTDRKKVKALKYIPTNKFIDYINFLKTGLNFPDIDDNFGKKQLLTKNMLIFSNNENNQLYNIEFFNFYNNCGLYFIANLPSDFKNKFELVLESLGETGIGAKKSTGYGKFKILKRISLSDEISDEKNLNNEINLNLEESINFFKMSLSDNSQKNQNSYYILLSSYLPTKEEISELKSNDKNKYQLIKCSGFINKISYSPTPKKHKQVYMISSGSSLKFKPLGRLVNLSKQNLHPIYKLGKPILLEVQI